MTLDINRTSGQGMHEGSSFIDIETPPINKTNDRLAQQRIEKKAAELARKKRLEA